MVLTYQKKKIIRQHKHFWDFFFFYHFNNQLNHNVLKITLNLADSVARECNPHDFRVVMLGMEPT